MNMMIMMMKIMMMMTLNNPGAIIFNRDKWGQLKEQLWADYHNDAFSSRHSRVMSLQPYKCSTFTHNITQKSKKNTTIHKHPQEYLMRYMYCSALQADFLKCHY